MKKIIYTIVVAFILSIILALLFPEWFFEGDAIWTYRNNVARVDISFRGHLKNGRVKVTGADLRHRYPLWLSNKNYQGTVVEIPLSYQNKKCWVGLTPQADEFGQDATLVLEFRGGYLEHDKRARPAWVRFRNITLNGQLVAKEKVVWHNTPFVLKSPTHSSSELTLALEVCKPLATSDIAFVKIFMVFTAFLLFGLFFTPLKKAIDRVLTFINRKDIVQVISDGYWHIDPVYRRSLWIIFGVLCFAFGFHTICFMWGNHDWYYLNSNRQWLAVVWSGRYMVQSVKVVLSNGVYLPLIYDFIIFITLALNAVLLCKYWGLEKRVTYFVICGLVLTVQPFTLSMLYYVHMTPEVFIGVTCALIALILSEKIALVEISLIKKILYSLTAIILINFSLGMYPVLINTIAVAFVGRLLVQAFDWDISRSKLKFWLKLVVIPTANMILGIASYKLVITYVFPADQHSYNTGMIPSAQIPKRLCVLLKQCFRQLCEYEYPFISQWVLWVFLGCTLVLVHHICSTGNWRKKIVRSFLLFGALFATQTAMLIAQKQVIDGRVELFGLVFFEVLVMVLTITRLKQMHNLLMIAGSCVIFSSILSDLDCLRVWKLGFDAEKMLWNRVLARIEIQKDFLPGRKYDIIEIGDHSSISLRKNYYTGTRKKFIDNARNILNYSYDIPYEFYYPARFQSKKFLFAQKNDPRYVAMLRHLYWAGVLQKAEVWPRPNGLIVWKNIILFVTDGNELDNFRKKFERELGKK